MHGFRCYDNRAPNVKCQRVLVLALCLVTFLWKHLTAPGTNGKWRRVCHESLRLIWGNPWFGATQSVSEPLGKCTKCDVFWRFRCVYRTYFSARTSGGSCRRSRRSLTTSTTSGRRSWLTWTRWRTSTVALTSQVYALSVATWTMLLLLLSKTIKQHNKHTIQVQEKRLNNINKCNADKHMTTCRV